MDLTIDDPGNLTLAGDDQGGLLTLDGSATPSLKLTGSSLASLTLAAADDGALEMGTALGTGPRGPQGEQGPPGPPGTVGVTVTAKVNLNAYTVVKVMSDGTARPASSLIAGDGEATTGVTTAAALAGEQVPIRTVGAVNVAGTLPVGPLYLGTDGALTPDHNTGMFQLRVGYAQTPNLLVVRIDPPIYIL